MIENELTRSVIDWYPGATAVVGAIKPSGGASLRYAMPDPPPSFRVRSYGPPQSDGLGTHRPSHLGGRFSANAFGPSM